MSITMLNFDNNDGKGTKYTNTASTSQIMDCVFNSYM